jgi:hypothetical protein
MKEWDHRCDEAGLEIEKFTLSEFKTFLRDLHTDLENR